MRLLNSFNITHRSILSLALLAALASAQNQSFISSAWYASWHANASVSPFPLASVPWSKYTSLVYSFAVTTEDPSNITLQDSDKMYLPEFVKTAHSNNVQAHLAIGGYSGSQFFSLNVGNDQNRTAFAQAIKGLVDQYQLDGINFDWEYPGKQGIGCNIVSPNDTSNFLSLLQTLRGLIGTNTTLSAAVGITPFANTSGLPSYNVSGFAQYLDYIQIMNYDIFGPWSTNFGPNAPFNDSCAPTNEQFGSAASAVKMWTAAGMPANKIVLAVGSYGHSVSIKKEDAIVANATYTNSQRLALYPPVDSSVHPAGDEWDAVPGTDMCGNQTNQGGVWMYWGLIKHGWLSQTQNGIYEPASGLISSFDNCSGTPFLYNDSSQVMVSYDDEVSFMIKGAFIRENGLLGFSMWEAAGDYNNNLLNAIQLPLKFNSTN